MAKVIEISSVKKKKENQKRYKFIQEDFNYAGIDINAAEFFSDLRKENRKKYFTK